MTQVAEPSPVQQAQAALESHQWREAHDLLAAADRTGALDADGLELLAQSSFWVGRLPDAIDARERAYAAFVKAGQQLHAAATAVLVGRDNLLRGQHPIARAWLNRAERILAAIPEGRIHGWLEGTRAMQAGMEGDIEEALTRATRAYELATRHGDHDLEAIALSARGVALINLGKVDEGLALVDEAAVPAVAGEIDPLTAGAVCCSTIGACTSVGDWARAGQWIDAQDRWCQREQINGFPGMCRLYRAETKRFRGDWTAAETEARRASDELEGFIPAAIGVALYEIGVIRLRRGDLPAAEEALLKAHGRGRDPEPAISLLRLAQGRIDEALASIQRALDEPSQEPAWGTPPNSELNKLTLLPAQVEIALAAGDTKTARQAANELATVVDRFPSDAGRASVLATDGAVAVAEGRPEAAQSLLRDAIQRWSEVGAPWDTARSRLALASALVALGQDDRAARELRAARQVFETLGATPDLRAVDDALAGLGGEGSPVAGAGSGSTPQRVARTFVFTDIVESTKLAELLGDDAWHRLIGWHDTAIRSLVSEHNGQEVKATGDGFFLAFDDVDMAIACAIAIQRRFADQRRTQGFAPAIRIGIHSAEARQSGLDYIGTGVNQAARIGAAAASGEILASGKTLASARHASVVTDRRTVTLKGFASPVDVATIAWE